IRFKPIKRAAACSGLFFMWWCGGEDNRGPGRRQEDAAGSKRIARRLNEAQGEKLEELEMQESTPRADARGTGANG
ncbi:MAG: hypothetical protein MJZ74_10540, partial [Muribaculaceae bacterium]|nr:hypothetical protein [Muribaculaceae bacterium]